MLGFPTDRPSSSAHILTDAGLTLNTFPQMISSKLVFQLHYNLSILQQIVAKSEGYGLGVQPSSPLDSRALSAATIDSTNPF